MKHDISDEDFCFMVTGKYGWSVGDQAERLLGVKA